MVLAAELALTAATTANLIVTNASDCVFHAAFEVAYLRNGDEVAGVATSLPLGEHLGGRVDGLFWSSNVFLLQFVYFELCRVILQIADLDKRLRSVLACPCLGDCAMECIAKSFVHLVLIRSQLLQESLWRGRSKLGQGHVRFEHGSALLA